jgi:ElaB protein
VFYRIDPVAGDAQAVVAISTQLPEQSTMESIFSENGRASRGDQNTAMNKPGNAPRQWRSATGQELSDLMADVQDLLGRVANVADPEVIRLRAKVADALSTAKSTIGRGSESVHRHARDAMYAGDSYVRDRPWQSIGVAAAVGLVVGFLVARR